MFVFIKFSRKYNFHMCQNFFVFVINIFKSPGYLVTDQINCSGPLQANYYDLPEVKVGHFVNTYTIKETDHGTNWTLNAAMKCLLKCKLIR